MKKVCKNCRLFVSGEKCPACSGTDFSESWNGRINIIDVDKSLIAKKLEVKVKGEYAIKVK